MYARRYFYGEKGRTNRGQALGLEFGESLESGNLTGKADMDVVIAQMPKYAIRDKKIQAGLSTGQGKNRKHIPVLVKPDSVTEDFLSFYEYKTGAGPWTQEMVNMDDQMLFYIAGLYLKVKSLGGVAIPKGELVWAPTEKVMGEDGVERPRLTGEILRFPTTRTFVQVLQMHARISKAWREIGEAMEAEIV